MRFSAEAGRITNLATRSISSKLVLIMNFSRTVETQRANTTKHERCSLIDLHILKFLRHRAIALLLPFGALFNSWPLLTTGSSVVKLIIIVCTLKVHEFISARFTFNLASDSRTSFVFQHTAMSIVTMVMIIACDYDIIIVVVIMVIITQESVISWAHSVNNSMAVARNLCVGRQVRHVCWRHQSLGGSGGLTGWGATAPPPLPPAWP